MALNNYFKDIYVVVINLKERKDKRDYIKKELKSRNIEFCFYTATKHQNPKKGCLNSHITVIKEVLKKNMKYLKILN